MSLNKSQLEDARKCSGCEGCTMYQENTQNCLEATAQTALHYLTENEELRKNELEWIGVNNKQGMMLMQQAKVLEQAHSTLLSINQFAEEHSFLIGMDILCHKLSMTIQDIERVNENG